MAYIQLADGRRKMVQSSQALNAWRIVNGYSEPENQVQAAFCKQIKKVNLDWHTAPDEYVHAHLDEIIPLALNEWTVDSEGEPLRPATRDAMKFAEQWGLFKYGHRTPLAGAELFEQPVSFVKD